MTDEQPKKLNKAQEVFISEYLQCFNATEAYSRAYPKAKRDSARANGSKLLADASISAIIQARLSEVHMSADEAIKRLSDMARGDIGQFVDDLGSIDLQMARDAGLTPLIKKFKQRTITKIGKGDKDDDTEIHDVEIELHDAQGALDKIIKLHGRYKEVGTESNPIVITTKDDNVRYDRAVATLADAVREIISGKGDGQNSKVDTTEQAPMVSPTLPR